MDPLCKATNFLGEPCPYTATIGDYCVIHAGGWDYLKVNAAMLSKVYGQLTTISGIVSVLITILGAGKAFNVVINGETRTLALDEIRDRAETLMGILDIVDEKEPQQMIENLGPSIIRLHEDVTLVIQHVAANFLEQEQSSLSAHKPVALT